jgi:hypothetical protein
MPVRLTERAAELKKTGGFLAGPLGDFEKSGRLQLSTLIWYGLYPSSTLLDVGCGSLRAGYWFMNFLEPGRYHGIEPRRWEVEQGLRYIVEPELVEYAQPRFAYNDNFDLTVFDTKFDFVVARSIWSHATKSQIRAMLDSFVAAGAPQSALFASYLPASRVPGVILEPFHRVVRAIPKLTQLLRRVRGHRLTPPDYRGTEWNAALIGHRRSWLRAECEARQLGFHELPDFRSGSQIWVRITHP